jgi:hypothetical protein
MLRADEQPLGKILAIVAVEENRTSAVVVADDVEDIGETGFVCLIDEIDSAGYGPGGIDGVRGVAQATGIGDAFWLPSSRTSFPTLHMKMHG